MATWRRPPVIIFILSSLLSSSSTMSSNNNNDNSTTAVTASTQALEERLSALLNSDKFSVASYLNLALHTDDDDDSDIQRKMAELALQLQLQTQSCHEDIGRIGAELQAVLPRCAADVNRVSIGLEGMKMDASVLLTQVHHGDDEVSSSLETLSTLHALRTNLSKTKEILQAAATWDSTLASIAPLLAQQNLSQAVQQLQQLERGERALRGMPNNKQQRKEAIQKIRTQIQTLLQPQLKHALSNMHTRLAPLQQCVQLYTALNTLDTLQEEYVKNRPTQIHKAWFSYSPTYNQNEGEAEDTPSFVKFLPNWFDAVLSLLAEERRQSFAVFGPDLAPGIITKVLWECFRPILSSFESRLDSLYSSSSTQNLGSLQSICVVYEATLEFLSLAYESVAGSYLDVAETTSIRAPLLYEDVTAVILQIASPFSTFQERLAALEEKDSNVARQLISKDIQQTAHSVTPTSLSSLQDATERLQDLSPFIFPLAEGAIGRFELLNGGYHATRALATVDKLVSSHAGELAIAVRTLSATMTANENHLAENFDEQHVLCALQVLKIAGIFRRDLKSFEDKTRERMGLLTERMIAFQTQEKELEEAVGASSSSSSSFLLPDSLSVVEVDSMLTKAVCATDNETDAALSVLQRLATTENAVALYPQSEESVCKLAGSCHSFVFDVCSAVPRKHLSGMPSMSAWTESSGADSIDSYGTLPQSYITQVGEHMLALVQALEPFASDSEALELAEQVMGGVKLVANQPWRELLAAAGASGSEEVAEALMNGKDLADYLLAGGLADEDEDEEEEEDAEDEAAKFCNSWLDVVGLAVTGRLFERILRIQRLTPKGCDHLAADLNYLINVLSALGVSGHPHPLVNHFAQLVTMDDASLREQIASRDRRNAVLAALRAVEVRIALMRGISSVN